MQRWMRDGLIVAAVAATVFFTGLGGPRLWDRDETRNAGCAVEMLRANDWVTPVFNAELRTHKPVLTYWLMMLSYAVLGVSEFSARLPSAMYGVGTCLLTWFMGRRLMGTGAGLWSGLALASTLMFGVASRAATPDAPLIFWSTLAMALFVSGTTRSDVAGMVRWFPEKWSILAAMYAAMGMAVLAKGPIGLVLPTAVLGMFLLLQQMSEQPWRAGWLGTGITFARAFEPRHFLRTCWRMRPVTALLVAGAIAVPWYVWVHLRTNGEWTYGFFVTHNVGRAMNAMEGHRGNVLFYPVALLIGFFPWSTFWLPAVGDGFQRARGSWRQRHCGDADGSAGALLALCWVGVYLSLFSLARTKLPSYITPCYPGMALLIGPFMDRWQRGEATLTRLWPRLAYATLIVAGLSVCVALPILSRTFLPGEELLGLVGLIPLAGGALALWLAEKQRTSQSVRTLAVTAVTFCTALFAVAALRIDRHRHIEDMVAAVYGSDSIENVQVGSLASTESSWVFYCRQPIASLADPQAAMKFVNAAPPQTRRVLLVTSSRLEQLGLSFPTEEFHQTTVPMFLEHDQLVILAPRDGVQLTAGETESARQ